MNSIENIDKLQEEINSGPVVKRTYKELCDWIGWKPNSNHNIQLKSLSKWMRVIKTDEGYVVLEIYDEVTRQSKTPKQGRPRKEVNPDDYIVKRLVGRPRKKNFLTIDELEERQGYSLRFRTDAKYSIITYSILMHDVLLNDNAVNYTHNGLMIRLGIMDYDVLKTEDFKRSLKDNPDLFSFEYYVKSCCETILQLNILKPLCDTKNIFTYEKSYYTYKGENIVFGSDLIKAQINSIIEESLNEYGLSKYSDLYYSKTKEGRNKAKRSMTAINQKISDSIGWDQWYRGYNITLNPNIPKLAIRHLEEYDVEAGRLKMHELIKYRIKDLLHKKASKFTGYNPETDNTKIAIGTGTNISKEAYEDRCQRIDKLIDRFITI